MIEGRALTRDEVPQVWEIDRRERIERIFRLVEGALVPEETPFDVPGWPQGEIERYTPLLLAAYDRGGWFYGLFDGEQLVAVAVLDNRFLGAAGDQLQLDFLHVSRDYRGRGLARRLFAMAADEARRRGARALYISATPSEHTIGFYLALGAAVNPAPDPELYALEPEDIHLVYEIPAGERGGEGVRG